MVTISCVRHFLVFNTLGVNKGYTRDVSFCRLREWVEGFSVMLNRPGIAGDSKI